MHTKYYYDGADRSLSELARISGHSIATIKRRLTSGWTPQEAVTTPLNEKPFTPSNTWEGKVVQIRFQRSVPNVKSSMQPILGKTYTAFPCYGSKRSGKSKLFYVIHLDGAGPLIVYPGEFEVLCVTNERNPYDR